MVYDTPKRMKRYLPDDYSALDNLYDYFANQTKRFKINDDIEDNSNQISFDLSDESPRTINNNQLVLYNPNVMMPLNGEERIDEEGGETILAEGNISSIQTDESILKVIDTKPILSPSIFNNTYKPTPKNMALVLYDPRVELRYKNKEGNDESMDIE